jgi:hypothetical protein
MDEIEMEAWKMEILRKSKSKKMDMANICSLSTRWLSQTTNAHLRQ